MYALRTSFEFISALIFLMLVIGSSCGVKGPPLPPIPASPQRSENTAVKLEARPSPSPVPRPTIEGADSMGNT